MKKTFLALLAFLTFPAYAGTSVPLTINTSEAVTVTGSPRVAVDVGGQTRYATYTSGSGTNALTFTLLPQTGDVDLDGITVSSPIDLNGGTMKDAAGNNATLTFTPPNTSGIKVNYPSLGMDFVYDADGRYSLNGTVYNDLSSFLTAAGGTFTRASIGTYYDSTGTLQTAASGVPRFDYDPVTHAAKGILIEESRTNLLKNSADFLGTGWSRTRMIATSGATTAPDGTLTGTHISDNGVAGATYMRQATLTYMANTKYAISIYAKKAELDILKIDWYASTGWAADGSVNFNLTTGTATPSGSVVSYTITPVGNGWFRCVAVALFGAATQISTYPSYAIPSPPLDSTSGFYVWGAQIEQASFATSYIPTTSATVTRAADVLSVPTGAWFSATSGSLYSRAFVSGFINPAASNTFVSLDDGSTSNFMATRVLTNFSSELAVKVGGVNQLNKSSSVLVALSEAKLASSYSAGSYSFSVNGNAPVLGVAASSPSVLRLQIGRVGTTNYLNQGLTMVKYYPTRVSDAFLQQMTQ